MDSSTIDSLLRHGAEQLSPVSPSPRLDAEILLGFVLNISRIGLITNSAESVTEEDAKKYNKLLVRRIRHEPIAYLVGEKEFFGLSFQVSPDVLVPRPETELLVEQAIAAIGQSPDLRVLDLGTGSGCIAVAIAATLKSRGQSVHILATDKSDAALNIARKNAAQNNVSNLITFVQSDWFSEIAKSLSFDLIVSNPPYIAIGDTQVSPELMHEPQTALYAQDQGLSDVMCILRGAIELSRRPRGILIEIGAKQGEEILERIQYEDSLSIFRNADVHVMDDLAGHARLLKIAF